VLHGVRVHVRAGEVCGLLGPNGAGKTTTIAAALGLLAPDAGRVRLFGQDPLRAPDALRARVGLVPERDGLTGWMTATDYLRYWAVLQGCRIGAEDAAALLEQVGLDVPLRMPTARFSQGMRRRLAMARALVAGPELLILDEPANGLDPGGRRQLLDLLHNLAQQRGVGVLLCTHLLEDVERICDRIAVLISGRTVTEGSFREVLGQGARRYRLRLGGAVPEVPLSVDCAPVRLLRCVPGEAFVELHDGAAPETAWRALLFAGWPIQEVRRDGGGLEALYRSLTSASGEVRPANAADSSETAGDVDLGAAT
jgi:ABC-type multidrug transport system ATPase subunit